MIIDDCLEQLKNSFKQLPGIGAKTAERLAFYLISGKKQEALELAKNIKETVNVIKKCNVCNMLSASSPCWFCSDEERNDEVLCVVEKTKDIYLIEKIKNYNGKYFVLEHLISPLDGFGPKEIKFTALQKLVNEREVKELILALNPSIEGESTISFISSKLQDEKLTITRLAIGLPAGGNIEFTTSKTLKSAFDNRQKVR